MTQTQRAAYRPQAIDGMSAAERIAAQLRTAIATGELKSGDRLGTEPELADEFNVSRATLREAMRLLRNQGMLRTTRGARGGHYVANPQTGPLARSVGETFGLWFDAGAVTVAEVDEARVVVERACVRLAAERRTDEDVAVLRAILAGQRASESLSDFLSSDTRFHAEVARIARNRLLELPMIAILQVRPRTNQLIRRHDRDRISDQHDAIADGIASGDPDRAEEAFLAHASFIEKERLAALEARHQASDVSIQEIGRAEDDLGDYPVAAGAVWPPNDQ